MYGLHEPERSLRDLEYIVELGGGRLGWLRFSVLQPSDSICLRRKTICSDGRLSVAMFVYLVHTMEGLIWKHLETRQ